MLTFIIVIHSIVCILLVCIILMQSGRGGGLTEAFASAESVFGAQTSSFLIKGTTILASLFLVTCLSIAFLSAQKSESLMSNKAAATLPAKKFDITIPIEQASEDMKAKAENVVQTNADEAVIPESVGVATEEVPVPPAVPVASEIPTPQANP